MKRSTQPIPPGFHTVTASLTVRNGSQAIEFYKKALGAEERMRMAGPDGKIGHAELKIGDSIIFLNRRKPRHGQQISPDSRRHQRQPLSVRRGRGHILPTRRRRRRQGHHAGNRYVLGRPLRSFVDPYGHTWGLSTHTQDMTEQEIEEARKTSTPTWRRRSQPSWIRDQATKATT